MFQFVVMLFAPGQVAEPLPGAVNAPRPLMATRPLRRDGRRWRQITRLGVGIAANAMGLLLFLMGLGMVLRLAEVLLS